MKWYVEVDNDCTPSILVGDRKDLIPIYKSIARHEKKATAMGVSSCFIEYLTWDAVPRQKAGMIAIKFGGHDFMDNYVYILYPDAILDHIVNGSWVESSTYEREYVFEFPEEERG